MPTDPHERVYADLVGGLLDSRDDPATERFDAELARAVDRGELDPDLARRLRFWQRSSLRALTDHTRTVLPTVLGVLAAARRDAHRDADELGATLAEAQPESAAPTAASEPAAPPVTEPGPEPAAKPTPEPTPAPEPAPGGTVVDLRDTPEPASTLLRPRPTSLEARRRLIVAGLMTAPTARPEQP
ncbi:MAG TPA: hypothetical protein VFV76_13875 [Actinomycetes bacterium]|nr:hypothetical protein [Actinomycetes bacterium]